VLAPTGSDDAAVSLPASMPVAQPPTPDPIPAPAPEPIPEPNPPADTTVVKVTVGAEDPPPPLSYVYYAQKDATASNRKGIVLFGDGNNESNPTKGSISGAYQNALASKLATLGYIAGIVGYRDQPYVGNGWENWNSNTEMLAADMNTVANALITEFGSGLTRAKVVTGGFSYTSYALLTSIAATDTLKGTRGFLASCGSTYGDGAGSFRIPIFSLFCGGPNGTLRPENSSASDAEGPELYEKIKASLKSDSGFYTDTGCSTHCGGAKVSPTTWTDQIVARVQLWLP